jgi:hypothetical protein
MIQYNIIEILFYVIIITLIVLIIYFNIISGKKYIEGLKINITDDKTQCKFSNLPGLNEKEKCKNGDYYIKTINKNYYLLTSNAKYYLDVCKSLCGGSTLKNGQCSEDNNPLGFNACIQDLQPAKNCKNSATPLAQKGGINYYASKVSLNNPCQN